MFACGIFRSIGQTRFYARYPISGVWSISLNGGFYAQFPSSSWSSHCRRNGVFEMNVLQLAGALDVEPLTVDLLLAGKSCRNAWYGFQTGAGYRQHTGTVVKASGRIWCGCTGLIAAAPEFLALLISGVGISESSIRWLLFFAGLMQKIPVHPAKTERPNDGKYQGEL